MADLKISQLAAVTDVLTSDEYVLARAGATKKITGANLKAGVAALDGWVDDTAATWTRTADQTFTVTGDRTAVFSKGTRLRWTQTTVKYGVVVASSHAAGTTTVTIATTTDYVLTAAAISANYYSYAANPQGYPDWFAYTPSWTSSGTQPAIGNGSLTGKFRVIGRACEAKAKILAGSTTTFGTGTYSLSLPITESASVASTMGATLFFDNSAGAFYGCFWRESSLFTTAQPGGFLGPTTPVAWATSDQVQAHTLYEI